MNGGHGERFPCGRCLACRINRSEEWALRLAHEYDVCKKACFVTLTYCDEKLPLGGTLRKAHLQNWMKKLRLEFEGVKIKYYCCGEYGDRGGRPHYHGIIFNVEVKDYDVINKCWDNGFIYVKKIIPERLSYVTGYVTKKLWGDRAREVYGSREAPFALQSKGLGLRWIEEFDNENSVLINLGVRKNGKVKPIPRYYVKKMKTEIPKELWEERKYKKHLEKIENYGGVDNYDKFNKWERIDAVRHQVDVDLKAKLANKTSKL